MVAGTIFRATRPERLDAEAACEMLAASGEAGEAGSPMFAEASLDTKKAAGVEVTVPGTPVEAEKGLQLEAPSSAPPAAMLADNTAPKVLEVSPHALGGALELEAPPKAMADASST